MNLLQAIGMAAVEGVTEFLPISSTGHLVLTAKLLAISQTEFVKSFEIVIQLGAILAVIGKINFRNFTKVLIAFLPTGILGLILYKTVKTYLLGNAGVTIAALFVGGVFMILHELKVERKNLPAGRAGLKIEDLNRKNLLFIGLIQAVSMIPGVSRAMATIFGGMGVGLTRKEATEFSFLLAIPTMAAATGMDLVSSGWSFSGNEWIILGVGFAGAFVTASLTVKWLIRYAQKHDFRWFGIYRVVLALLYLPMAS